jgi:hypothetical protein
MQNGGQAHSLYTVPVRRALQPSPAISASSSTTHTHLPTTTHMQAPLHLPTLPSYHELVIRQWQQRQQLIHGFEPHGIPQAHAQMAPASPLSSKPRPPTIQPNPQQQSMTNTIGPLSPARTGEGAPITLPLSIQMAAATRLREQVQAVLSSQTQSQTSVTG